MWRRTIAHLEDGDGRNREEAAGGPVSPAPGAARGSSSVSSARQAIANPGGPTHLSMDVASVEACCSSLEHFLFCGMLIKVWHEEA
jgi:hypothetical protein